MSRKVLLLFLILGLSFTNVFSQKHTFTKNVGIIKNHTTNETTESTDIDDITIENLGKGMYSFTDSKESIIVKYINVEDGIYLYRKIDGWAEIRSAQKLSLFALGYPGKLGIMIGGANFDLRYILGN
jgi:hypothetical protein